VSRYQKGKTNLDFTGARDSEWQWHLLGHMQVCTSLQTDNHASIPPLKVEEAKWKGLGVNDHWQQMKGIMMKTAKDIYGMTKGSCRHKETWWWTEDIAEAGRKKKIKYGK